MKKAKKLVMAALAGSMLMGSMPTRCEEVNLSKVYMVGSGMASLFAAYIFAKSSGEARLKREEKEDQSGYVTVAITSGLSALALAANAGFNLCKWINEEALRAASQRN